MKRITILLATCAAVANAQIGRVLDWPTFAHDPQRSGWEKNDSRFMKEALAKTFQLLWKRKVESKTNDPHQLTPPLVTGTSLASGGLKELAGDGRVYWQKHLEFNADQPQVAATAACPGTTAMPTLLPIPPGVPHRIPPSRRGSFI